MQLHEVELQVLPRRDVAEAARVPLGDVRERFELIVRRAFPAGSSRAASGSRRPAAGPYSPAHEAERAPFVRRNLASLEPIERSDELVDVLLVREREARAAERIAMVMRSHC